VGALEAVYREAFTSLRHRAFLPSGGTDFRVSFHPYAGLRSTIYQRTGHYEVRLADLLEKAPLQVHYSLACILLSKIDRRLRIGRAERLAYESWSRDPGVIERHEALRKERGVKAIESPRGEAHDLTLLFHKLNREYFNALLPRIRIGFSKERSRSLWGHHDSAHQTIVINKVLDSPRVPSYVIESIVYHEMLHHARQFREAEKLFKEYDVAQKFLTDVAHRRIRL
jgi:hypothetical protein